MTFDARTRFPFILLALALTACGGTETGGGAVAGDGAGGPVVGSDGARPESAPPSAPLPRFQAPEGWVEVTPVEPPQRHAFRHEGEAGAIKLLVYAWPASVGGLESNVARWAGERAGSLTADERKQFEAGSYLVTTVFLKDGAAGDDAHGTSEGGTFHAYIELPGAAPVWTVKATGPTEAMLAQRATLEAFVQNL